MIAKILLDKKREGKALGSAEIREFIDLFTKGEIPDYQMAAMAMAICCRGMNERETADLTEAMKNSGRTLTWNMPTADKHSTGGVGDKLSLIIQPLAAACGVYVPSLTGRGLGLTGGTADKLETIPGYNASLSLEDFQKTVEQVGVSMTVQTEEITPADKKLYALRDVTGTVASIPLIVGSILSKKLAEGAHTLVFDVKCGSGTFMKTKDEAIVLAKALVGGAKAAGRKSAALVTDMSAPLGRSVGNVNEVAEAIDILAGKSFDVKVTELSIEFAALMVALTFNMSIEEARTLAKAKLADGSAYRKFVKMVEAQGGDLTKFEEVRNSKPFKFTVQAMRSGFVTEIDAEKIARAAFMLGAGRAQAGDKIDPMAGVELSVKRGDKVTVGMALATLMKSTSPEGLEKAAVEALKAFKIESVIGITEKDLVLERIDG